MVNTKWVISGINEVKSRLIEIFGKIYDDGDISEDEIELFSEYQQEICKRSIGKSFYALEK